jgi:predicted esterase
LSRVRYGLISNPIIAAGYSNGANIAGALLLMHPEVLSGAVLFRPMVPFRPRNRPKLDGVRIFLSAGRRDPIVPAENTLELARLFEEANADVLLHWYNGGHQLSPEDVGAAAHWLASAYNQRR